MFVAHAFQVGVKLLHQTRIVQQDDPSFATFTSDGQMLIIKRKIEILYIERKSFTDT